MKYIFEIIWLNQYFKVLHNVLNFIRASFNTKRVPEFSSRSSLAVLYDSFSNSSGEISSCKTDVISTKRCLQIALRLAYFKIFRLKSSKISNPESVGVKKFGWHKRTKQSGFFDRMSKVSRKTGCDIFFTVNQSFGSSTTETRYDFSS